MIVGCIGGSFDARLDGSVGQENSVAKAEQEAANMVAETSDTSQATMNMAYAATDNSQLATVASHVAIVVGRVSSPDQSNNAKPTDRRERIETRRRRDRGGVPLSVRCASALHSSIGSNSGVLP